MRMGEYPHVLYREVLHNERVMSLCIQRVGVQSTSVFVTESTCAALFF